MSFIAAALTVEDVQSDVSQSKLTPLLRPQILSGVGKKWVMLRIWLSVAVYIIRRYPLHFLKVYRQLLELRNKHAAGNTIDKLARIGDRYYINSHNNGWPSSQFYRNVELEARHALSKDVSRLENLRTVFIAVTKNCPLSCEHCCEGPELNQKNTVTLDDHRKILRKLQDAGVASITFGGGEPMAKLNDVIELLEGAKNNSDFWMYTSGFNLTEENAKRLKRAGLTGVIISLDHHSEDAHNKFRRNNKAFTWAMEASRNATKADLVVTFTCTVTREFCTEENLMAYMELAFNNHASFIQLMEPRAVGNYEGVNVELSKEHNEILEQFFLRMNSGSAHRKYPIVQYPAYIQRRNGCSGAGSKFIYINTDGYITACPYCRNSKSHFLDDNHEEAIASLQADGCGRFSLLNH